MSIVELVKRTSAKYAERSQISQLKSKINDDRKILEFQTEIKNKLIALKKATVTSGQWLTDDQIQPIQSQIKDWCERYYRLEQGQSESLDYEYSLKDLRRIHSSINDLWQAYAKRELDSARDLSLFLIRSGVLSVAEDAQLKDKLSELERSSKRFPLDLAVKSFLSDMGYVNQQIVTLIPDSEVQSFIRKAQDGKATGEDLSTQVFDWFKLHNGLSQIKITLG